MKNNRFKDIKISGKKRKNIKLVASIAIILILGISIYFLNSYVMSNQSKSNSQNVSGVNTADEKIQVGTEKGDLAPDFSLKDINGNTMTLSKLRGKKVILNFWATTCPYCKIEMPELNKFYQNHKKDVVLLAIDIGEEKSTVENYLEGKGYGFTILLDSDAKTAINYKVQFIPMSFFIDEKGIIRSISNGAMTYDEIEEYYQTISQ
ncbi:TlpA family protein disulfide reductase [Thermoanaerobacterium thermosaccharolyticum]|jgi:peroxiredoxin|uniref:Alkyl hydroperoxide reductase/ Thiol specific antioxidant/ Mal allergen n=3 Tax=Thermoanaerobacterium thermosaccharolyticum TaxID=1517 RepID=D9TPV6_THETC|nr:TlpA disulfide reductase family protein [Thermoanaerobacterium thermosaccharolyticum]ADL69125.1 alkyl hydroperoxide reductase/ Thiol specific antioxidant/ Mal allergen [Thermoanaerobacterium thermosaccharolyticum DSM 571]AGB19255.1 Peroxiredoxin [Thermoanaerobacterium thermosaccharolyticum M0795]KAA5807186.1 TlpA family protein disulfide reductase [Thermoanaerobacterium thermosaccharolyticum]OXT05883.1 thiol-disulfide isomerase [Thermoanaerobacterium thermosaccharolyticum]